MKAGDRVRDAAVGPARFQEIMGGERLEHRAELSRDAGSRPIALSRQFKRGGPRAHDGGIFGRLEPGAESGSRRERDKRLDLRQLAADLLDHLLDEEVAEIDPRET